MSREELLLRVLKLYKAAESAKSCLEVSKVYDPNSPYWTPQGAGGSALNMLDQALSDGLSLDEDDREVLWKGFFRNALPLLFKGTRWGWNVCETCQHWLGEDGTGKLKEECFCGQSMRPIKWSDFTNVDFTAIK